MLYKKGKQFKNNHKKTKDDKYRLLVIIDCSNSPVKLDNKVTL